MNIINILNEIAEEGGSNKKMEILAKYKGNEILKTVLYKGMSKRIKFWVKQIPAPIKSNVEGFNLPLEVALKQLEQLENRSVTGNEAQAFIASVLGSLNPGDAEVITRVIKKDLKIGMGSTNVNKVFGDLIETTPYMGCSPFKEKTAKEILKSGGGYIQTKMDGRYCNAIVRGGEVELESRAGEPSFLDGALFIKELWALPEHVYNGELTIDGVDRYTSNGIIASLISFGKKKAEGQNVKKEAEAFVEKHGMTIQTALDSIRYTIWDTITVDEYYSSSSNTPYSKRLEFVANIIEEFKPTRVTLIQSKKIATYNEAMDFFKEMLKNGEEGAVLKALNGAWKDGHVKWQCKMKLEMDVDLQINGFNYGTVGTKNEGLISSLFVKTSDGLLETNPGGISEDDMAYITKNKDSLMGKIVVVKCSGISKDRDGNYALLHPVFKEIRNDKTEADSLERIKDIQNMILGLK